MDNPFLRPLYSPVAGAGLKYFGIRGSLYPFNKLSIDALILNPPHGDIRFKPLGEEGPTSIRAISSFEVITPAATAASASCCARSGATFDTRNASLSLREFPNFIHFGISP